jgi:hypothetical protein
MMAARTRFFLAALLALTALPVAAQTGTWTTVASTGSMDSNSLGIGAFNGFDFQYNSPGTSTSPIVAYYNVTNTFGGGLTDTPPWKTLELTYINTSSLASVAATLIEVDPCTGATRVLCTAQSTTSSIGTSCVTCDFKNPLKFQAHVYFVTIRMTRLIPAAFPVARALRIF